MERWARQIGRRAGQGSPTPSPSSSLAPLHPFNLSHTSVAQLVEHLIPNQAVPGSSPGRRAISLPNQPGFPGA